MPSTLKIITRTLTPIANTMFWIITDIVFAEILDALAILEGSSVIRTTSAASIALSEPIPPIAIPTSERISTGASLIPSPTNATFFLGFLEERISSSFETLSCGNNCE